MALFTSAGRTIPLCLYPRHSPIHVRKTLCICVEVLEVPYLRVASRSLNETIGFENWESITGYSERWPIRKTDVIEQAACFSYLTSNLTRSVLSTKPLELERRSAEHPGPSLQNLTVKVESSGKTSVPPVTARGERKPCKLVNIMGTLDNKTRTVSHEQAEGPDVSGSPGRGPVFLIK